MERDLLKKGDKVVMYTCLEAETHNGRIWTCEGDEFKANSSGNGVFLEGFSGWFYTEYLQKVNVVGIELKNIDLTGISEATQWNKMCEEEEEFTEAYFQYRNDKTDENKNHVIEELFDEFQSKLGVLEKEGIAAEEVQAYYPKHLEKLSLRPRKKNCENCKSCNIEIKDYIGNKGTNKSYTCLKSKDAFGCMQEDKKCDSWEE